MHTEFSVVTGESTDADRLEPVSKAHLSGGNGNTIGNAGVVNFISEISAEARVKIKTTVNPMGYDIDSVSEYGLEEKFVQKPEITLRVKVQDPDELAYGMLGSFCW